MGERREEEPSLPIPPSLLLFPQKNFGIMSEERTGVRVRRVGGGVQDQGQDQDRDGDQDGASVQSRTAQEPAVESFPKTGRVMSDSFR